jgi:hypothetical protein
LAALLMRMRISDMPDHSGKTQLDKFKEAARQLETDDDPERFKERLSKLVKHKPVEKPAE